jgi:hypothetical protein
LIELVAMAFHSYHPTDGTHSADPEVASHLSKRHTRRRTPWIHVMLSTEWIFPGASSFQPDFQSSLIFISQSNVDFNLSLNFNSFSGKHRE